MLPHPSNSPVFRRCFPALLALTLAVAATRATAQELPAHEDAAAALAAAEAPAPTPPDYSKPMGPADPFNRGTPRGSVYGFITAARAGDFERAAEYLDLRRLSPSRWEVDGPQLAHQLDSVLERNLLLDFEYFSAEDAGAPNDGLPGWQDHLGSIETQEGLVDLLLQRVPRADDGVRIWKVSAATVEQIPALDDGFGLEVLEPYLPPIFFDVRLLGLDLWQWLGIAIAVLGAWLLSWLSATVIVKVLASIATRTRSALDDRLVLLIRNPARVLLAVAIFHVSVLPIGLPLTAQARLVGAEMTLIIVALAWLLLQVVDLAALAMQHRLLRDGDPGEAALISPGKRTVKAIIIVLAALFGLDNLGFNVGALLAGLGLGGIAVALAAQKSIENLFGGATLIADRPVRVGNFCKFGDNIGTVEEIGLRSTRVRTLDRTVVTVPNAEFSSLQIENFAERDRIRLFTVLGLRYETTPDQLRFVMARLREMLLGHPKIDDEPARVRFVNFGAYSLDLEIYAYVLTSDWNEFLQIREDVYLRAMDLVSEAGTGFAFPSSTTYIGRDDGLDETRSRAAEAQVEAWRAEVELPFPEFSQERRKRLENRLDWPPEGSPGHPRDPQDAPGLTS